MLVIPGTCSACVNYANGQCKNPESQFADRSVWSVACVDCGQYKRSDKKSDLPKG